ncbi:XIAP-associated factor 1 isoform X2 [Notamacropus eugenii]|uniref:XIAP-associated factor 1 isoform X2 n=1 Tax=Notamacropus eugenii TaxID=9315 RepID=UPI003B67A274
MEGDLQLCTNCEKEVPSDYFFLHEAHCLRFRVICPECKEVILKEEMKDHQENGHKQDECHRFTELMRSFDACLLKPEESSPVPRDAEPAQVSTRERAVRPKEKGSPAFKGPSSPWPARGKKEEEYDVLEHCSHCPILLPLPVLKQHEGRRLMSRRGIGQMRGRGLNPSAAPNGHCPMDWQALVKVLPM